MATRIDPSAASDGDPISVSELFHENSKQRRHDAKFGRRIGVVNATPAIHRVIAGAFKSYPGAARVALPGVQPGTGPSFEEVVASRRSARRFTGAPLEAHEVSRLLQFGSGLTGNLRPSRHGIVQPVRAAPSGGALYPVETYVALPKGAGFEAGVYHYAIADHALELVKEGDCAPALTAATSDATPFAGPSMTVILTLVPGRTRFKYGERGYRFAMLEAGHIAQNFLLEATAMGLGGVPIGGFIDDEINAVLDIDGCDEAAIYLIALGRIEPEEQAEDLMGPDVVSRVLEMMWTGGVLPSVVEPPDDP